MEFDIWMTQLIIPFGQSILYDLSKKIFIEISSVSNIEKLFEKVVRISVKSIINGNILLSDAITEDILYSCKRLCEPNVYQIVQKECQAWGEENLDIKLVTAQICNNLLNNIITEPELCNAFTFPMLIKLVKQYYILSSDIENNNKALSQSLKNIELQTNTMQSVLRELYICKSQIEKKMLQINQTVSTSEYIKKDYKEFFIKPLCFEKNLNDGVIVSLKDVYIENDYRIIDFPYHNEKTEYKNVVTFIKDFIDSNLLSSNYHTSYSFKPKHIKLLFIKGHPGSGKSSLFYYLAYLKSQNETFFPEYKFYFIRLIEVYDSKNGEMNTNNPIEDFIDMGLIVNNFSKKTVIVLDGLDEICVARNLDIKLYCNNLIRVAAREKNLKIIITTRLNYVNISHFENKNVINIQLLNLSADYLSEWVNRYFDRHNTMLDEKIIAERNIKYIKENPNKELGEIFAIPLLFYMIVTSKINIFEINSVGELYDKVFNELSERNYNESEIDFIQKHGINTKIPEKLARQIAIEISYEMYRRNKLLLKINSDELNYAINNVEYSHYKIQESDKREIENLFPITFFYKDSIDVVEFAHKSIMEFFTAEKLYQKITMSNGKLIDFICEYIVNPVVITNEVLGFLKFFLLTRYDEDSLYIKYSGILTEFKEMIYSKFYFENKNVKYTFETRKIVLKFNWYHIREILNFAHEDINLIINDNVVKNYIIGSLSIIDSQSVPFLDNSVIQYNFTGLCFNEYNIKYCDLSYCQFQDAQFQNCSFSHSNLSYINFSNISIKGNLNIYSCEFENSIINNIYFIKKSHNETLELQNQVTFKGCSFDNAVFENLDLTMMKITSILSMKNTIFKNVTISFEQLLTIGIFQVILIDVTVYLDESVFNKKERIAIKNAKNNNDIWKIIKNKAPKNFNEGLILNINFDVE